MALKGNGNGVYVRFMAERNADGGLVGGAEGEDALRDLAVGPFNWVRVTYYTLSVPENDKLAFIGPDGFWRYRNRRFSDFVILPKSSWHRGRGGTA